MPAFTSMMVTTNKMMHAMNSTSTKAMKTTVTSTTISSTSSTKIFIPNTLKPRHTTMKVPTSTSMMVMTNKPNIAMAMNEKSQKELVKTPPFKTIPNNPFQTRNTTFATSTTIDIQKKSQISQKPFFISSMNSTNNENSQIAPGIIVTLFIVVCLTLVSVVVIYLCVRKHSKPQSPDIPLQHL